jgi:penicillin-binding protein 1A
MNQRRPPTSSRRPPARRPRTTAAVPRPRRRSALWRWRRPLFVVGLVGVAATGGAASVLFNIKLPPANPLRQTSFVCAANVTSDCGPDNAIATFSAEQDRINVPLDQVPKVLVDAVLATEDRQFFQHGGVDPMGIARAVVDDLRGSQSEQGGSTITQQYVKNVYLNSERSFTRKIKEAVLAVKLERELPKKEILERYLNTIYFGRGAYGVGAASRAYFGKDVRQIGLPEASYLAGLIRAPEAADARANPTEASRRRRVTLNAMVHVGDITAAQADAAEQVPWTQEVIPRRDRSKLDIDPGLQSIGGAYFVEAVRQQVAHKYGDAVLYGGGLRIYVTLDPTMQKEAWNAVTNTLNRQDDPAAALVSVDDDGRVKAMVGGRDFDTSKVNYALGVQGGGSGRQAGSSFKPFALAAAVRQGISLKSRFNAPSEITLPKANNGEDWVVHNYADEGQGVLDLVDATKESSNTAFAQLMLQVGPQNVVDLAHKMGVSAPLEAVNSLVLGTKEVSPLDMATGFSTFANRGVHNDATLISRIEQVDENGATTVLEDDKPSHDRVLSQQESDLVTYALRQVVAGGTGHAANFANAIAGKTGTTNKFANAWFVGFTPKLTTAVWMGYPNPKGQAARYMTNVHGIDGVTGGTLPTQIWTRFMKAATAGKPQGSFVSPKTFPGKVLNPKLVLTATTSTTVGNGSTTTTLPGKGSTTTSVTFPPGFPFDSTSTTTGASTTTTTGPLPPCPAGPAPPGGWPPGYCKP